MVNSLPVMQETWIQSLGQKDPLEEDMATHSSILARECHGQRSLVGYSPWDRKELDKTESLTLWNPRWVGVRNSHRYQSL